MNHKETSLKLYEHLSEDLPDKAITQSASRPGMSDINGYYVFERLTQTFGMAGVGWYWDAQTEIINLKGDNKGIVAKVFFYYLIEERDGQKIYSAPIVYYGG